MRVSFFNELHCFVIRPLAWVTQFTSLFLLCMYYCRVPEAGDVCEDTNGRLSIIINFHFSPTRPSTSPQSYRAGSAAVVQLLLV